jgi:hypothetical protein
LGKSNATAVEALKALTACEMKQVARNDNVTLKIFALRAAA